MKPVASSEISAEVPDWSREAVGLWRWNPSRQLLRALRDYQRFEDQRSIVAGFRRKTATLRHRFWSAVTSADIPLNCRIDGGLLLPHPSGVVIHPLARIGPNCLIMQGVTIGANHGGVPVLVGHVDIGPGAKVLGALTIGIHAVVGANAVVLRDVPPGVTVVGAPARALR